MLDARIASALNKIIPNSHFKKKVSLEEQKAQKEDGFSRGRRIAFMIFDYFRVTHAHDAVLDYADWFSVTVQNDNDQEFDFRWEEVLFIFVKDTIRWCLGNEVLLSMTKIPSDETLESLCKLRVRESDQLKNVLELYDMDLHQKMSVSNYQKLYTMVKKV